MKKIVAYIRPRLPWINVPLGILVALLQRTPAVRIAAAAGDYVVASPVGQLLRAAFTLGSLGAVHSVAGATAYVQQPANPIAGTVGTALSAGFAFTGAPSDAQSWSVLSGQLPPGVSFVPAAIGGTIIARDVGISGTPTQAGNFSVTVRANGLAGQSDPVEIRFQITGGVTTAPAITTHPLAQTVAAGGAATFTVAATGSPAPTYQWRKDGAPISGATAATFSLAVVQMADAGAYSVVVTNSAGSATSSNAILTVTPLPAGDLPVIVSHPFGYTVGPGGTATLSVVATGPSLSYEWRKDGSVIPGATSPTLTFPNVSSANAGSYSVRVSNGAGVVTSSSAAVQIAGGVSRLANLSVRANLGASQTLIVGFATNGTTNVLLRGIGPTLGAFGVPGAYNDPRLEVFEGETKFTENEDWNGSLAAAFSAVGAFPLSVASKDAALQTAISGPRTAQLLGPDSGVVLVEVYDAGSGLSARLVNVSARNQVGTGDDILIAGFVVGGSVAKTLLIRAVGPTLGSFGVEGTLGDPKLEIYGGAPAVKVIENDNWSSALAPVFGSVGAFPLVPNSQDAALLVTLPPGAYSAQVSGIGGGTGEALVEVYEVP